MPARRRGPAATSSISEEPVIVPSPISEEPVIVPSKLPEIASVSAVFFALFFYLLFKHYKIEHDLKRSILINLGLSFVGFIISLILIPVASRYVLRRNLFGYDINKKGTPQGLIKVPESLGIVIGVVFLVVAIVFQYFNLTQDSNWLVEYNAALASICFMILLGFIDDVLDVPWRMKLMLPSIAALPLLMAYAGHTTIIIPKPLIPYVGLEILDLGGIYKLYMFLLAVFCTNSINIHAGINGLEVGQTAVIASAIMIHNVMQIGASSDPEYKQAHAFSIYLAQPLLTTSLGLLCFNWYPSSVFVGDTYTYFAGMSMAVIGILGHFSETLLIFFLPQVLNFLASCPQLFGFINCPRHRLPRFDPETGLLTGTRDGTLVNIFLRLFGRCTEKQLCIRLLGFQALCCVFCFGLRHFLAGWYK
ncbi:UDP-N-acetylglucosamine--dolichyl-phosphate N-acetylglucosaminephosphotransferase-like [Papaver somniferum]|uniref:UDP-N-acetylglucosamine--dolichyl-phosphate N-acetylglucosaminephosphotransferase-like n=1 Tax=Papaver somniferum TaxID=3469 RepID=UPI000E703DBE|nr:UDP-N-acetylglucosamine--dolichyl-phosphate N-acetylglucosaminephosphotransferase-like [Papaver somniferum]